MGAARRSPARAGSLTDLDTGARSPVPRPRSSLTETDVSGTGGCNTFSGTYTTDGDTISFGPLASTMMACEPPIMEQETVYFAALDGATTYAVDGDTLTISGDAGTLTLREGLTGGAARRPGDRAVTRSEELYARARRG